MLDPDFTPEFAEREVTTPGRRLELDPQYLAERHREAEAQQTVFLYD